jgi:hypothetical protein
LRGGGRFGRGGCVSRLRRMKESAEYPNTTTRTVGLGKAGKKGRRTILRRHRHNIPDIISRSRTKYLPETLRALFALRTEARAIVFGLLAVPDEIYSWFSGDEGAQR